jgi:hypothetical protein
MTDLYTPTLTARVEQARLRKGQAITEHMQLSHILNVSYEAGLNELVLLRLKNLYSESAEATAVAIAHYNALKLELYFHKMGALNA